MHAEHPTGKLTAIEKTTGAYTSVEFSSGLHGPFPVENFKPSWRICRRTPIKIFREADLGAHKFSLDMSRPGLISFGPEASDLHFASFRIAFWCSLLEPDGDLIRELCQSAQIS